MKKKAPLDLFLDLTRSDLDEWAGSRIADRGRKYQQQGRVTDLAVARDNTLIAWVIGSERYATKVLVDDTGLPESICSCPYARDCKHGVAVVYEYLKQVENSRHVPTASADDERLALLEYEEWDGSEAEPDENALSGDMQIEIDDLLNGKTRAQLIDLIHDLSERYPEMAQDLADRRQITSGETQRLVTRLKREIQNISDAPGWQNYWQNEGYTPDYSGIRSKLDALLQGGRPNEVLALGEELIDRGTCQVEMSHDEGETAMEIGDCMLTVVEALDRSSLAPADRLAWAVDAVLKDQFDLCEAFSEYLHRDHPKETWSLLADGLLAQLKASKAVRGRDDFSRSFARDRLSGWAIEALERAGRKQEIIPLCETEAKITGSYDRLVLRLMNARRHEDAEHWIQEGIRATRDKWPGIASSLREKLREIRTRQKNWPVVAAMQAEEFVRQPSWTNFTSCRKAAGKVNSWPEVRAHLLDYLESGKLPWTQNSWPLPASGLATPEPDRHEGFPRIETLMEIAIYERKPDEVLRWYDQRPKDRFRWYGIDEDNIAAAVQRHFPERAVALWKNKAERLIAQVKPQAYQEAGGYLRKAARVMAREKKQAEWKRYLQALRATHTRKRRLMDILDDLEDKPILKRKS